MKNLLKLFFFVLLFFLSFNLKSSIAAGTFEIDEINESYSAIIGYPFKAVITFFYSGTEYKPRVVIIGREFPDDIKIYGVQFVGTSFYSVEYSGIPKTMGNFPLIFSFTDDYGALVNKKVNIKVTGLVFNTTTLPNATVGVPYSYKLFFNYPKVLGENTPRITFDDVPSEIDLSNALKYPNALENFFNLSLVAHKAGTYSFKAKVKSNNLVVADNVVFNIVVDDNQPSVINQAVVVTQKPVVIPEKVEKEVVISKPPVMSEKKVTIKDESKDSLINATTSLPIETTAIISTSTTANNKENIKIEKWYTKIWKFIWRF